MTAQVSAGDVGVLSTRQVRGPGLDHLQQVPTAQAVQRAGVLAAVVGRKAVEVIGRARGEGLVVGTFVAREGGFVRVCRVLMQVYEGEVIVAIIGIVSVRMSGAAMATPTLPSRLIVEL